MVAAPFGQGVSWFNAHNMAAVRADLKGNYRAAGTVGASASLRTASKASMARFIGKPQ